MMAFSRRVEFVRLIGVGGGRQRTLMHSVAAKELLYRTLATPSVSLSKRTTLVTSPILAHSSRISSLMSRMAAGSSYGLRCLA